MDWTILLVEDSANDRLLVRYALRKAGVRAKLMEVEDGVVAIRYLSGEGEYADRGRYPMPDVIITDLKMPLIDGFGFLEWLQARRELGGIPRVVLSGSGQDGDQIRAERLGAGGYYVKPVDPSELAKMLHEIVGRYLGK